MFPNPQAALPLPTRPSLDHYRKRAKDLVKACKACRSGDADAIRAWAIGWVGSQADEFSAYARARLTANAGSCTLSCAQFVIARSHGFAGWPKFAAHIQSLERANSKVSAFESAVDAIVAGDTGALARLLRDDPSLVRARSTREHHATLLIYTSANGVEGYRQISPKNVPQIAEMLLDAGAVIDATAAVYGGECTTLGLVATSAPPAIAGVQIPMIELLLRRGSRLDFEGSAGNGHALVRACLANGQPHAAAHLADRGAPLDLAGAAGLGRVEALAGFFDGDKLAAGATPDQLGDGFALACVYGRTQAVEFLLDRGFAIDTLTRGHGEGSAGLHIAAYHGYADLVSLLIARGANVNLTDKTWKTPPLKWLLTGWTRNEAGPEDCYRVVAQLVRAGAIVTSDVLEWDHVKQDPRMLAALQGKA
jgi:Ankyrin repeats (3 copies)